MCCLILKKCHRAHTRYNDMCTCLHYTSNYNKIEYTSNTRTLEGNTGNNNKNIQYS